ncbi:tubulin monoglutamylase TTLL4 isoform X2 [Halichoeres trimaculatus]|uniref:tubulin monoglutamylase TTLL4 isoform X2 n=1 Tax=Halichoeres trimaculatus TaxID=147232 RepID=UPI003D9EF8E7
MPTNQSSPWGGGKLRADSNTDSSTTAASLSAHTKTAAAPNVPSSQTSHELFRRKGHAKTLPCHVASSASSLRHTPVAEWGNGDGCKASTKSQFAAVPDQTSDLPRRLNRTQNPGQGQGVEAGSSLTGTKTPSTCPLMDCQNGFQLQLTGTKPKSDWLQTCPPVNRSGMSRGLAARAGRDAQSEFLQLGYHSDLPINRLPPSSQTHTLMPEAADCSPSVPPPCLTLSEHQGAVFRENSSSLDRTKVQIRSTRRLYSAKAATKCSQRLNSGTKMSNSPLVVRGGPPPRTSTTLDFNRRAAESRPRSSQSTCRRNSSPAVSPCPKGVMPTVPSASISASQEKEPSSTQQPTLMDQSSDVVPGPEGALVGSVTNQISAIYLTRQGQLTSVSPPSLTGKCEGGGTQLSGLECVMQVDGVEEELPDELENACSDDGDSDCSSVTGTSSTASIALGSGVEEPMLLEAEDDREEKPALVPSLFPFVPPTLYFSTASEKVELLPAEQRRLLKWKMSTVTPNVVKHTISRSHFKVTKKSHDWLGCWGHHMKSPGFKALGGHQKLNHFPGTFQIGRKDRLWRNLSKMQLRFGKQEFSFFPRTFILPQDIKLLRKAWEDGSSRQKWIIKPPASARGIGISVIHKWSQMPRKRPLLVQKYLHKPYLISGNKFDLRIYVYVTSYDPLRIYIFTDGLVRFASCKYSSSMKTLSNKFMHLTNYSVNKKNSEYQTNSDDKACQGHKWALKALWQYLGSKGVNTTLIWEKIKDIVIKTLIASEPYVHSLMKMHLKTPYSCHELFGFDIMLDENLKPWILEVNISPSLHSNTALDVSIKGQMIRDLLNLAGFRIPNKDDVVASCSSASSSTSSLCGGTKERTKPELSADEKVKRAFYLTQRFPDQDFLSSVLDVLTPDDVRVLAESEDELNRLGEFERVFPSPSSSRYLRFFECPRYFNILLDQWEQKFWNNRTKGVSLLRTLCQKGVHLGTNDPAHMWSKCSYISRFGAHRPDLTSPSSSRVVVSHLQDDEGSDGEVASVSSLPVSQSPGSSVTSSACTSPQPSLTQSLLPQQFASL